MPGESEWVREKGARETGGGGGGCISKQDTRGCWRIQCWNSESERAVTRDVNESHFSSQLTHFTLPAERYHAKLALIISIFENFSLSLSLSTRRDNPGWGRREGASWRWCGEPRVPREPLRALGLHIVLCREVWQCPSFRAHLNALVADDDLNLSQIL